MSCLVQKKTQHTAQYILFIKVLPAIAQYLAEALKDMLQCRFCHLYEQQPSISYSTLTPHLPMETALTSLY